MRKGVWGVLLLVAAALLAVFALPRSEMEAPPPPKPPPAATPPVPSPEPPAPDPVLSIPPAKPAEGESVDEPLEEPKPLVLAVRSKESGQPEPKASAWLVAAEDFGRDASAIHPGPATVHGPAHAADGSGRIVLPAGRGDAKVAVRAPWSAWVLLDVTYGADEITVELVPGGTVKLPIENWGELEEARVFSGLGIRAADAAAENHDEEIVREMGLHEERLDEPVPPPGKDGTILLEGIACGPRTFAVRRGEWWVNGDLYGSASGIVVAGETVEITLPTKPTKAGARAPIEGTVTVAEEWGFPDRAGDGMPMEIRGQQPTNAPVQVNVDVLLGKFKTEPIPPGRYSVEIDEYGWGAEIDVPQGRARYAWTIPAPATLRLRLVDAVTGRPLREADLSARTAGSGARSRGGPGEDGEFVLRVIPGKWEVSCEADGYQDTSVVLEATGPAEFRRTVAMKPAATITVEILLDGKPWEGSVWVDVERKFAEDGELGREFEEMEAGGVLSGKGTSTRSGKCAFGGITPGEWVVKVKPIPGFEPLPEKSIQATQGGAFEVSYDLVRAK